MTVIFQFVVMGDDYPVALYTNKGLADRHADWIGGFVQRLELSTALPPEVGDPVKVKRREENARISRELYQREREQQIAANAWREAYTIDDCETPTLCACQAFSTGKHFVNQHGYCSYCGGFYPQVIREKMGDAYLQEQIDKLDIHYREAIRGILVGTRKPGLYL